MSKRVLSIAVCLCALAVPAAGQLNFQGLIAGQSTRSEVERVFGKPAKAHSETLAEYRPTPETRHIQTKVYVQYRQRSAIVERIEVILIQPYLRDSILEALRLPPDERPLMTQINARGVLEEYYGAPFYIVLTYAGGETERGVARSARYSPALFAAILKRMEEKK